MSADISGRRSADRWDGDGAEVVLARSRSTDDEKPGVDRDPAPGFFVEWQMAPAGDCGDGSTR